MERPELSNPFTNGRIIGHDVDPNAYHRRDPLVKRGDPKFIMSRSELMTFVRNPWKWVMGVEDEGSKSTEWGTLMDCIILSPDRFDEQFVVAPDSYPANKSSTAVREGDCEIGDPLPWDGKATFCKKWKKENAKDKTMITSALMDDADRAQEILYSDPEIVRAINGSKKQVMITSEYKDVTTGLVVPFKILIDLLPDLSDDEELSRSIIDFKTAQTAEPREWAKHLYRYDYHIQAACYLDVYSSAVPNERDRFKHIVQENTAPFFPMRHSVSETLMWRLGREAYVPALRKYCECVKENKWPGYEALPGQQVIAGWHEVSAPDWALK